MMLPSQRSAPDVRPALRLPRSLDGTEIVAPRGERQGAVNNGWNCRFARLKYKAFSDLAIAPAAFQVLIERTTAAYAG